MRDQLEQMQNMGGLAGLMDKLPGMGQIPDSVKSQVTGKEVPRMVAIINSMTKKERRNPALLNGSRRARIAKGSGTTPADVNKLLKQFQQMEKMMSKLSAGGMKGMMRGMKGMMGGGWRGLSRRFQALSVFLAGIKRLYSAATRRTDPALRPGIHSELTEHTENGQDSPDPWRRQKASLLPHRRHRHRNKRDGRSLERLGFYNPVAQGSEKRVELNTERVNHWVSHGAQLTDKVRMLVKEASSQAAA